MVGGTSYIKWAGGYPFGSYTLTLLGIIEGFGVVTIGLCSQCVSGTTQGTTLPNSITVFPI